MEDAPESHSPSQPASQPARPSGGDPVLAVALSLLSLAAGAVLYTQLQIASVEKPLLESQLNYSAQRLTNTKSTQTQTDEAIRNREEQIKQSAEMETKYAAMLTDLLELAKTDGDARVLVQKWKIQPQGQPGVAQSPQPAPSSQSPQSSQPASAEGRGEQGGADSKSPKTPSTPASKLKVPFSPAAQ